MTVCVFDCIYAYMTVHALTCRCDANQNICDPTSVSAGVGLYFTVYCNIECMCLCTVSFRGVLLFVHICDNSIAAAGLPD